MLVTLFLLLVHLYRGKFRHKVELPFIFQLEHDEDVLEFYDQPPAIKLDYQSKNDRRLGVLHTPDFFVIRRDSAGWEECKPEEQLKKLAKKSPHRYILSEDKGWHCPPGENYSNPFGLYYHLRSDAEIDWNLQRNLVFLEDYLRAESLEVDQNQLERIIQAISEKPGIKLVGLLDLFAADSIYTLIAKGQIYFVQGQWVECISQYYAEFQGRSEKELKLATSELRNRYRNNKQSKISAKKLADFLSSIEAQEVLLEQRLHDAEATEVFRVIEGGKSNSVQITSKVTDINTTQINHPAEYEQQQTVQPNLPEELVVYEEF